MSPGPQDKTLRGAAMGFGLLLALGIGELGLRLSHSELPSLAALEQADSRELGQFRQWTDGLVPGAQCGGQGRGQRQPDRVTVVGAPGEGPLTDRLWVAGDSLVAGWGVGPLESWPLGVGTRWAQARGPGARVQVRRMGGPGLGVCGWAAAVHQALDRRDQGQLADPGMVLLQVFADDLEVRTVIRIRDRLVLHPVAAGPGIREGLVRHSYLANRLWFAVAVRGSAESARNSRLAHDRAVFDDAIAGLGSRLDQAAIPWRAVLVGPAGAAYCGAESPAFSDCDWLQDDLLRMGGWLADAGHPVIDAGGLWARTTPDLLPEEESAWAAGGALPIHPGPAGHQALADRVFGELASAWDLDPDSAGDGGGAGGADLVAPEHEGHKEQGAHQELLEVLEEGR